MTLQRLALAVAALACLAQAGCEVAVDTPNADATFNVETNGTSSTATVTSPHTRVVYGSPTP